MGRKGSDLGAFHKAAAAAGLTYAEAQIQETSRELGKIRAPHGSADGRVYSKVSTRNIMRSLEGGKGCGEKAERDDQ